MTLAAPITKSKRPEWKRTYNFDFGAIAEIADDGDTITGATVAALLTDGALTIGTPAISGSKVQSIIQAGTGGVTYRLLVTATLSSGSVYSFECDLEVLR